ncbi:alpha-amylase family glycosyl hydrolase [Marinoscillum sp. MHG1-6]|uniref:DUF4961 domain-containing protein n=1 Tax=Marinoscillum sp. MHG1-6 TaxID=2959627 RepID=UPI0021574A74|nr:DUF4961 domain-containing protein [Marinoscillum sp. MHG1-6]
MIRLANRILSLLFILVFQYAYSQEGIVSISPSQASPTDEITITFDASKGTAGLVGASSVYMHSGVVSSGPDGTDWTLVVGDWGQDNGVGKMSAVAGQTDKWEITLTPKNYYSIPDGTNAFRLSMVFRNADGSAEGKGTQGTYSFGEISAGGDIYVDLDIGAYIDILKPSSSTAFVETGSSLPIEAKASASVSSMKVFVNDVEKASVSSGTTISYNHPIVSSGSVEVRVDATINGLAVSSARTVDVTLRASNSVAALPAGITQGINYGADDTKVTLALEAPGKEFVYAVGDFNNWELSDAYLMNVTPDGELFWIELTGLTPGQQYVFQYWVDGVVKVGDPYAELVADPWNDQYISAEVFPNIPTYDKTGYGVASVFETAQTAYTWAASEDSWVAPRKDELVVYELLIRDFLGSRSYNDLIDTIGYLKNLGVNAIELMPIMEFEANSSWGYNPSYYFAPDKYYGTKDDLKKFIETAHQNGMAVILDMVLNHAYPQNSMVKMYWDESNNTVSASSPWFNPVAKHPFNVGIDFNHESQYTKNFVDSVNHYWLEEYHFDGYRFDLSKGFTQTDYGNDVGAWGQYDQGRIDLLKRMATEIWSRTPEAYVILEHFAEGSEETVLAGHGMLLWRGKGHDYGNALKGTGGNLSGSNAKTHVTYMESHDEERMAYYMETEGQSLGNYDIRNELAALERYKMGAAFLLLQAGPKMIWQFGELGYNLSINYINRLAEKPLPWGDGNLGLYEDEARQYLYRTFAAILKLRNDYPVVIRTAIMTSDLGGNLKKFTLAHPTMDVCVIGNFGLESGNIDPAFTKTGAWFDYFSGEQVDVADVNATITLKPGEFHVYTSIKVSDGFPDYVKVYENPVTVNPTAFFAGDEITITFDATKASDLGTAGLVGAEKVYMHAGAVTDGYDSENLVNIVGNLADDSVGIMTKVDGQVDKWQITLTPRDYFSVADGTDMFRIGMYFRDASNTNLGYGFRDEMIFLDIQPEGELITITPSEFSVDNKITITFNAGLGNRGLVDATKIYMHSGVVLTPTGNEWSNVVGTWGADDGVGEMTNIEGTNLWEITFTPADYYSIANDAYWMSIVFRDETGNAKGSGPEGDITGGYIVSGGDIFMEIPLRKAVPLSLDDNSNLSIYPNPASDWVVIPQAEISEGVSIYDQSGRAVLHALVGPDKKIDISSLNRGLYILRLDGSSVKPCVLIIGN